jgi:hypothetical protein
MSFRNFVILYYIFTCAAALHGYTQRLIRASIMKIVETKIVLSAKRYNLKI